MHLECFEFDRRNNEFKTIKSYDNLKVTLD